MEAPTVHDADLVDTPVHEKDVTLCRRHAVGGDSMGDGGTLLALRAQANLRAGIAFAPFSSQNSFGQISGRDTQPALGSVLQFDARSQRLDDLPHYR
jgi:hypothetical protein